MRKACQMLKILVFLTIVGGPLAPGMYDLCNLAYLI